MKRSLFAKALSCLLALITAFSASVVTAFAEADRSGKYVGDAFVAYGRTEEDARQWLAEHGWLPVCDLNEGKTSQAPGFENAVAYLGIRRTSDPTKAITDMATMNMKGGYSFDDYESLVKQKKTDIDEFINSFVPVLEEYRANYNGKGAEGDQRRAQAAHDLLNKFFDGEPNGEYAVNDTGKPLGDLLLNKTKTEIGDEAYNALSAEQKLNVADLQQIILESSGPAVLIVEQALALAADTAEDSWMDRLDGLTGADLVARIAEFAPEAAGQDLAPSAAMSLLAAHFEDYSKMLAEQWAGVHEYILWYEQYCKENGLQKGDDDAETYSARIEEYFSALIDEDTNSGNSEFNRFTAVDTYYRILPYISYSGEWGETLLDFFRPQDEDADYSEDYDFFAPLAAALSDGQRAALGFISLPVLLKLGADSESVMKTDLPSVEDAFENSAGEKLESISIYSGINRAIFRKGVALTSDALMQKNMGRDPYDRIWDFGGVADIISYVSLGAGFITVAAGAVMFTRSVMAANASMTALKEALAEIHRLESLVSKWSKAACDFVDIGKKAASFQDLAVKNALKYAYQLEEAHNSYNKMTVTAVSSTGRWIMGIGGALMIFAAAMKIAQIVKYYNRTFTMIPTMIVDEADIVSYTTDGKGKQVKLISFDRFAYYEAVKCNRQQLGVNSDAQDGVDKYAEWGCGDAADINADVGKQWLALYINRSDAKGDPILADSLTLMTGAGSEKMPDGLTGCLHMFTQTNPVKIDNEDFCFRSDNEGMYLYWNSDPSAFTASAFNAGYCALSGIGGLSLGIACTGIFIGRKKKEEKAA